MWTEDIFRELYHYSNSGAILATYSAKGSVRRAMKAAGYKVERLPGPPGKREIIRAKKS
jgi:tRNA U34 5-methylaminomethyl-2-thiouridine-forming methyltransferase MnmC